VDRILARVNATEAEREDAFKDWDLFIKIDYVFGILGHSVPGFQADGGVGQAEWHALRHRTGELLDPPTAAELEDFLRRYNFLHGEIKELVEDYRHYLTLGTQRRPDVWERRHEWGIRKLGPLG
jgi:hypothetical protein